MQGSRHPNLLVDTLKHDSPRDVLVERDIAEPVDWEGDLLPKNNGHGRGWSAPQCDVVIAVREKAYFSDPGAASRGEEAAQARQFPPVGINADAKGRNWSEWEI